MVCDVKEVKHAAVFRFVWR